MMNHQTHRLDYHLSGQEAPRVFFDAGEGSSFSASRYLDANDGAQMSSDFGYVLPWSGSITGLSCSVNVASHSSDGIVQLEGRINGTTAFTIDSDTIVSGDAGNTIQFYGRIAEGDFQFSEGDILTLYLNFDTFSGSLDDLCALMEVELDLGTYSKKYGLLGTSRFTYLTGSEDPRKIVQVDAGEASSFSANRYLDCNEGNKQASNEGYVMMRGGSVIALSCSFNVASHSADGVVAIRARKNNSNVLSSNSQTITSGDVGSNISMYSEQNPGVDTFTTDDWIQHFIALGFTGSIGKACAAIFLEFD